MTVPSFPAAAEARHDEGFLNSADHLRIFWQRWVPPSPRAMVLVLHGAGDHSGRYPGVTAALVRAGFGVALLDFRGHGQSDGRRWYVEAFEDYLHDLDAFHDKVKAEAGGAKRFVVAHSQGALVAATWALRHPGAVSGYVLSSPWFASAEKPPALKVAAARLVGKIIPWLPVSSGLTDDQLTSDPDHQRWTARDPLYVRSATPRWFEAAMGAQAALEAARRSFAEPLLVLAGGDDRIASTPAARRFVEEAASADKRFVEYPGLRHEIFNETRREAPFAEAVAWLAERSR